MLTNAQVYCMTSMIYLFRPPLTAKAIYKPSNGGSKVVHLIFNWEGEFILNQISTEIRFYKCEYRLLAAIEYIGTHNKNLISHYVAHFRRLSDKWEIYNYLCRDTKPLNTSKRVLLQKRILTFSTSEYFAIE